MQINDSRHPSVAFEHAPIVPPPPCTASVSGARGKMFQFALSTAALFGQPKFFQLQPRGRRLVKRWVMEKKADPS